MTKERVEYTSGSETIVGTVHAPTSARSDTAFVVVAPFTGVKEQVAGRYASQLAEHGYRALAFDARGYGESGGAPRWVEDAALKIEDVKASVRYARGELGAPRVVVLGVCAGATYAAGAAASGEGIDAYASVQGIYFDPELNRARLGPLFDAMVGMASQAARAFEASGEPAYMPAVSADEANVPCALPGSFTYYGTSRNVAGANWENRTAVHGLLTPLCYDSMQHAPHVKVPSFVLASRSSLAPDSVEKFHGLMSAAPRSEIWWMSAPDHFALYDGDLEVRRATSALAEWAATV